jgi:hypothetical protein
MIEKTNMSIVSKGANWATSFVPTQLILQMTFLFGDLLIRSAVPAHHFGPLGREITAKCKATLCILVDHKTTSLRTCSEHIHHSSIFISISVSEST